MRSHHFAEEHYQLEKRRQAAHITDNGTTTTVNGQETVGLWARTQEGRVATFLNEAQRQASAYDVSLCPAVLEEPFLLREGSEVSHPRLGRGVVRRLEWEGREDDPLVIIALVLLQQRH